MKEGGCGRISRGGGKIVIVIKVGREWVLGSGF